MKLVAIVPAAGKGRRMGSETEKPFILLKGLPILVRTLKVLSKCGDIDRIVVAAERSNMDRVRRLIKKFDLSKVRDVVAGGRTRGASVRNGLRCIDESCEYVLIHDGARPLLAQEDLKKVISQGRRYGAALLGVLVKPTIKEVGNGGMVRRTLERNRLWEVQTPQVFKRDVIFRAYSVAQRKNMTDDASLVERLGYPVKIVEGRYSNIKITTKEDLLFAEALLF